ncbi:MAG: glycosyltransferase family 4 protein [Candidatus Binatia bacterium]
MIRVLFVEASSGGVVGGSLTGLYHLIRGLDRTRFQPAMVLYEPKEIEADLRALGVPVHRTRRRRIPKEHALLKYEGYRRAKASSGIRPLFSMGRHALRLVVEGPAAWRLVSVIRREQPDVVHLGNGVRANFDGILACWLTRTPCVCHVKGFEKYSHRERWAVGRIDVLVCMTKAVEEHCARNGIRARSTHVVYDGLDEAAFAPQRDAAAVRTELGIANGAPCVGVIGNLQEWKGQAVLVEAMAQVVRAVPQARALIIGGVHRAGAAYREQLRVRIGELDLGRCLSITGFRGDIADVMNALDVVVHTSVRPEPFGRVILEGMLLGKPVVATAAGGVPELIGDGETGFLTPPGDPARLAERLIPLLQDPTLRRQVGQRAQGWARERFSLQRQVATMSAIYEDLAKGH